MPPLRLANQTWPECPAGRDLDPGARQINRMRRKGKARAGPKAPGEDQLARGSIQRLGDQGRVSKTHLYPTGERRHARVCALDPPIAADGFDPVEPVGIGHFGRDYIAKGSTVAGDRPVEVTEPLQRQRRGRARRPGHGQGFALSHQSCRGGQKPRASHLPGQLIAHTTGIHRISRHFGHRCLNGHAGKGPVAGLEGVGFRRSARCCRCPEGCLQPQPKIFDVDRHHDIAVGGDSILDRGQRVSPLAQSSEAISGCSDPSVVLAKGTVLNPVVGAVP